MKYAVINILSIDQIERILAFAIGLSSIKRYQSRIGKTENKDSSIHVTELSNVEQKQIFQRFEINLKKKGIKKVSTWTAKFNVCKGKHHQSKQLKHSKRITLLALIVSRIFASHKPNFEFY